MGWIHGRYQVTLRARYAMLLQNREPAVYAVCRPTMQPGLRISDCVVESLDSSYRSGNAWNWSRGYRGCSEW